MPPSHVRHPDKPLTRSPFVTRSLGRMALSPGASILDIPTGTGRHALFFSQSGFKVTVADIDPILVREAAHLSGGRGVTLDATAPLPFPANSFDAVVVVDFVNANLLIRASDIVRQNGWIIYESYAARGGNWRQLLAPNETLGIISTAFDIVQHTSRRAGPADAKRETVKILGRRR